MVIVGLTGSIGAGKSTLAAHLRDRGIAVCDADAEVHRLYAGTAAPFIEAAFPGTVVGGTVDRTKLSAALSAGGGLAKLEAIIHPLVKLAERDFLVRQQAQGALLAVLEIPLLFETGADRQVDTVVLASAPEPLRRARVLARPGMTATKFELISARQISDDDKRARSEFVVDTGAALAQSLAQLDAIVAIVSRRPGTAFANHWANLARG